jgi:WD40 repeat protein
MEKRETSKGSIERINQASDDAGSTISRRQFSLGLSGIVLAGGTILEGSDHRATNNALVAQTSVPQKLEPQVINHAQYVLSGTIGSVWSPDSRHLAAFQKNTVTLYDASTGAPELDYSKHTDEILTVKWSPNSTYLASSGFDESVHVWEAASGQTVMLYQGHSDIVRDVVWSPNQRYIASAGYDKTIQVWEALTGKLVITCSGHAAEIQTLSWSPDSRRIASTDLQNKTMIWRVI